MNGTREFNRIYIVLGINSKVQLSQTNILPHFVQFLFSSTLSQYQILLCECTFQGQNNSLDINEMLNEKCMKKGKKWTENNITRIFCVSFLEILWNLPFAARVHFCPVCHYHFHRIALASLMLLPLSLDLAVQWLQPPLQIQLLLQPINISLQIITVNTWHNSHPVIILVLFISYRVTTISNARMEYSDTQESSNRQNDWYA